jgi:hypothetical protein
VGASAPQKLFERHRRVQHSLAPTNEVFFHCLCQSRFDPRRQRPKTAFEKPVQQPSLTHEDSLAFALQHPLEFPLAFRVSCLTSPATESDQTASMGLPIASPGGFRSATSCPPLCATTTPSRRRSTTRSGSLSIKASAGMAGIVRYQQLGLPKKSQTPLDRGHFSVPMVVGIGRRIPDADPVLVIQCMSAERPTAPLQPGTEAANVESLQKLS